MNQEQTFRDNVSPDDDVDASKVKRRLDFILKKTKDCVMRPKLPQAGELHRTCKLSQIAPLISKSQAWLGIGHTNIYSSIKTLCVVFFPFILDIKFVGRTSRGHTENNNTNMHNEYIMWYNKCITPFLISNLDVFAV